jgi:hypothetical protein
MRCLHICNNFLESKVHEILYLNLDNLNQEQPVFYRLWKNIIHKFKNIVLCPHLV